MDGPALTHLIPLEEMTPGQVGAIRNQVITQLVRQVSSELNMPPEKLVVRDVRPFRDLAMYAAGTTAATIGAVSWRVASSDGGRGDDHRPESTDRLATASTLRRA